MDAGGAGPVIPRGDACGQIPGQVARKEVLARLRGDHSFSILDTHDMCVLWHGGATGPLFVMTNSSSCLPCVIAAVDCLRVSRFQLHVQMFHGPFRCVFAVQRDAGSDHRITPCSVCAHLDVLSHLLLSISLRPTLGLPSLSLMQRTRCPRSHNLTGCLSSDVALPKSASFLSSGHTSERIDAVLSVMDVFAGPLVKGLFRWHLYTP